MSNKNKEYFAKHSFSNKDTKEYLKETYELVSAPILISFLLGMVSYFISGNGDKVILQAVMEFLQLIGLKMAMYSTIICVGLTLLCVHINLLKQVMGWLTASIAKCGFGFAAVISGVYFGLAIPVWLEAGRNNILLLGMLLISLYFNLIQGFFVSMSNAMNSEFDTSKSFLIPFTHINLFKVIPFIGFFISLFGIVCLYYEPWPTILGAESIYP